MRFLFILVAIFLAFSESNSDSLPHIIMKALSSIEIPEDMKKYEGRRLIETTDCNAKCGAGSKTERRCLVTQKRKLIHCIDVSVECFTTAQCGIKLNHLEVGQSITLDCQTEQLAGSNMENIRYSWGAANGVITTEDTLFRPYSSNSRTITLSNVQEKDAGSYRCQMREKGNLVKVVYFGVKVTDPTIVDLNVKRIQAKNTALGLKVPKKWKPQTHKQEMYIMLGVGISAGVLLGIPAAFLFRHLRRKKPEKGPSEV